jgi:hypothetical protein
LSAKKLPWNLRPSDFDKPGWHTRPTAGYELMFAYLRLSPSYELARRAAYGRLTNEEASSLPSDFAEVQKMYELFGDVQRQLFRRWWLRRGLKIFGNPFSKPSIHKIATIEQSQVANSNNLQSALDNFLSDTRESEGLVKTLLVALPLGLRRAEVLKQVAELFDKETAGSLQQNQQPLLKLQGQRLRKDVLLKGIRLLWFRAAKPKWEYWRLGAKSNLSKYYSPLLNPDGPRKRSYDENEISDRKLMTKITYRALQKYEAIAENAARGRFPCEDVVDKVPFDYDKIRRLIILNNKWEETEKARLLAAHQKNLKK